MIPGSTSAGECLSNILNPQPRKQWQDKLPTNIEMRESVSCQPVNLLKKNAGTLIKEFLRFFFILIPEGISFALFGSVVINQTLTIDRVEKTTNKLSIDKALLK